MQWDREHTQYLFESMHLSEHQEAVVRWSQCQPCRKMEKSLILKNIKLQVQMYEKFNIMDKMGSR